MGQASARLPDQIVRVSAPARLHLGFLDLNGSLGRRFGSLGVSIERPATVVRLRHGPRLVSGQDAARAEAALERVGAALGLDTAVELVVETALPAHAGLGSGTQLGLSVGAGLARLRGMAVRPRDIAAILERGARSSIGIGSFESGGVILDGGRGPGDAAPPVVARLPVPDGWRFILVRDTAHAGLSGRAEAQAMAGLPPFPDDLAGRFCRLVLMAALPALAEGDADGFGAAIGEVQRGLGDHYAAAQGGRFTSPAVADVLGWLEAEGASGVGQSSWGPTGFAVFGDASRAAALTDAARGRAGAGTRLVFDCVGGNNRGAEITTLAAEARALSLSAYGD